MKLITIYKCMCDETRLRILNLLSESPLCVCHLQWVLQKSQVIVSRHLAYLRERKMVDVSRHQQWMIYSLPANRSSELDANLRCLQDCVQSEPIFQKDKKALTKLMGHKNIRDLLNEGCCTKPAVKKKSVASRCSES